MKTAGKWSWKLKFSKECVKTHLPNLLALKMDCAKAFSYCLYSTDRTNDVRFFYRVGDDAWIFQKTTRSDPGWKSLWCRS